jgi:hypothetical protein
MKLTAAFRKFADACQNGLVLGSCSVIDYSEHDSEPEVSFERVA